jgi:hypothetical protein
MHERELSGGPAMSSRPRELVLSSWRRSLAAGVAPGQSGAPIRLTGARLEEARDRSRLKPAVSTIRSTLSTLDEDARQIVAIGDARATLLWVTGDAATCERALAMHFQDGASWSEQDAGTNALGTAIAVDHAVQIFSAEHLVEAVHPWTCSAAPIRDPVTRSVLGVVDVTAALQSNHPHMLSVAALAAQAAESALALRYMEEIGKLRQRWEAATGGRRTPSLLIDAHGRVIASQDAGEVPTRLQAPDGEHTVLLPDGRRAECQALGDAGTILWLRRRPRPRSRRLRLRLLGRPASAQFGSVRSERALRSLELLAVLAMSPQGMTTEQLALAVYGEHGKAVTIRAQIHRLRSYLGDGALATHPYRLIIPVDGDWLAVRRLVAEGRPAEALRLYQGPLLADSDAPAIVEARGLLEESLRRSVLTTANPDLLQRWLEHPGGADDLSAARALIAALPCGDPRRAAATARAAAIARRMSLNTP